MIPINDTVVAPSMKPDYKIRCARWHLPGHRKHTNDTNINCDSGEAYQGTITRPSFMLLYFHPLGITASLFSIV